MCDASGMEGENMSLLKCVCCGLVSDETELRLAPGDRTEAWGEAERTAGAVCPECGGDEFVRCEMCAMCGEYSGEITTKNGICIECAREQCSWESCLLYLEDISGLELDDLCYEDFVVRVFYGVTKCANRPLLAKLLPPVSAGRVGALGGTAEDLLKEYCLKDEQMFAMWAGKALADGRI